MKAAVCWHVVQGSLVETDRRIRGPYGLKHLSYKQIRKVISTSETSVHFHEITWHDTTSQKPSSFSCIHKNLLA
jgi:hypothetical protein